MIITLITENREDFQVIQNYLVSTGNNISTEPTKLTIRVELPKPDPIGLMFEEITFLQDVEVSEASIV